MSVRVLIGFCVLLIGPLSASAQTAATWFLAEGADNAIFQQEILVGNPGSDKLDVTITLLPQADAQFADLELVFPMEPTSRLTVRPGVDFGLKGSASTRVRAVIAGTTTPADIVVERSMYFSGGARAGGHNAGGVTALAPAWTLAEGASTIFSTFVLAANPNPTPTALRATYLTSTGTSFVSTQQAAPESRATFWPQAEHPALASAEFSTVVESLTPGNDIVAERAMYFDFGPPYARSGHDALGVPSPSTTWYFAEGFTGGNATIAFETFLLLANPGDTATDATVDYLLDSGEVVTLAYRLPARERVTVWVDQEGRVRVGAEALQHAAFGMRVTAPEPIVAERSLYWGTPSTADPYTPRLPWSDGHATAGVTAPAERWAFAEGGQDYVSATSDRYQTFLLFSNPNPNPIVVQATFLRDDGTGVQRQQCVAGSGRANIWTADVLQLSNQRFATVVESVATSALGPCGVVTSGGEPFVAERAMYWGDTFAGGHANVGMPWPHPSVAPPPPADVVTATLVGVADQPGMPTSGRLSGGEWVVLNVDGVAVSDVEVWFGNRKSGEVVVESANRLRARTPVRTRTTGFGTPGPVTVEVRSRAQTAQAGTFTFTLRILAFGDSITWGTSNYYPTSDPNFRLPVNIARPYPRGVKNALSSPERFGSHVRVANAGWPGEGATGAAQRRLLWCLATGSQNACFHPSTGDSTQPNAPNPADFIRPFDVVFILEGVNDIINDVAPVSVRKALMDMAQTAQANDVAVVMTILTSYRERFDGEDRIGLNAMAELNGLVWTATETAGLQRLRFDNIDMGDDGVHPTQLGYDQMASRVVQKVLDLFPREPAS